MFLDKVRHLITRKVTTERNKEKELRLQQKLTHQRFRGHRHRKVISTH